MTIRPITWEQRQALARAWEHLRAARDELRVADCPRTLDKVRRALKSADGAHRHAVHRSMRTA